MIAKRRFCVNWYGLPRQFSVSPEKNGNVGIPSGGMSVYRDARVGLPGWGRVIVPMGSRQCKLALARTQSCTRHCARLRSPKCKFALQRMQTCAAADPALRYANCKLAHRIVHGDGTNGGFASIAVSSHRPPFSAKPHCVLIIFVVYYKASTSEMRYTHHGKHDNLRR